MRFFSEGYQFYTFLALVHTGFLAALLYDLTLHLCARSGIFLRLLMDVFLCVATVFLLFLSFYYTGISAIRLYMPFAFAAGLVLYRVSLRQVKNAITKYINHKRKKHIGGE